MSQINRDVAPLLEPSLTHTEALKYQLFKASQDTYTKVHNLKVKLPTLTSNFVDNTGVTVWIQQKFEHQWNKPRAVTDIKYECDEWFVLLWLYQLF